MRARELRVPVVLYAPYFAQRINARLSHMTDSASLGLSLIADDFRVQAMVARLCV
jgi:hypothetical protein